MTQTACSRDKSLSSGSRTNKLLPTAVITLLVTALLLFSCRQAETGILPDPTGKTGDVLIVMPMNQWESEAGESLRNLLSAPYKMLPQFEPVFDYSHVNPPDFREFLLLHRNIVLAEISPEYDSSLPQFRYNGRAENQLEIIIRAPDLQTFITVIDSCSSEILTVLEDMERQRITGVFSKNINKEATNIISSNHNLKMLIPEGWDIALDTAGFTWILKESGSILQGIFIYSGNASRSEEMNSERLIFVRDSVLKEYVSGSTDDSYMTTEKEFPPAVRYYSLKEKLEITELRGLWKTVNGISMGGPFMSISFLHGNSRFTTVEGFVYASGYNKRDYMREVEAIVLSAGPF